MLKPLKFHDVEQNSEEWFTRRLGKATMSNAPKFMANLGKAFGDPARAYAIKLALEYIQGCKIGDSYSNAHMERGHEQEPIARALYENENFVTVTNGGFFCNHRYGTSPDGLVGTDGLIEIKSVIHTTHYATLKRAAPDPAYKWQLIGHLDCTGRDWVDFVSYCSEYPVNKQLLTYRVQREDVLADIESLRTRRAEFLHLVDLTITEIL